MTTPHIKARPQSPTRIMAALVAVFLALWALTTLLPPYLTSPDILQPPSPAHWLGTNDIGQDVFHGVIYASVTTIGIALSTALLSLALAFALGSLAAIFPGLIGAAVLRLTDMFEIIPSVLILLLVSAWYQPGMLALIVLLGLTTWQDDVRAIRAVMLRETRRENVTIARAMGARWPYLLRAHIIPAIQPVLAGVFLQNVAHASARAAALSFLGLVDPRLISWGSMISDAMPYMRGPAWAWLLMPPTTALFLFLFSVLWMGRGFDAHANGGGDD